MPVPKKGAGDVDPEQELDPSGGRPKLYDGVGHFSDCIDPSILLSIPRYYYVHTLERVKGIEPSSPAWKAGSLPLSYTRV